MERDIYLRMAEQDSTHWWFIARKQILADQISTLDMPPGARLLEAGCGPGGNLKMLARFGALEAFELDEVARKVATERTGISVDAGALPDQIDYPVASFDMIAAFDVVEHIDQDRESVKTMASLLKPGGRLIITVPAYSWLWSRHDERHHHWRRYDRAEISAIVREAGLVVDRLSYFNTLLFPLIVAVRALKKLVGTTDVPDDRLPGPFVNRILRSVFAAERFWLRYGTFPFGISIICVARKE